MDRRTSRRPRRPAAVVPGLAFAAALAALLVALLGADARAQDGAGALTIALDEYQDSGVSGWATLTAAGDGLRVEMAVEGGAVTGNHPTHIHTGTCADFDPNPIYPLTTVVLDPLSDDGESTTEVDQVTLDELRDGDYVILVHKSAEELTDYFVCGDIKASNAFTEPKTAGSVTAPQTGAGSAAGAGAATALLGAGAGALAAALAAAGLARRRRGAATG